MTGNERIGRLDAGKVDNTVPMTLSLAANLTQLGEKRFPIGQTSVSLTYVNALSLSILSFCLNLNIVCLEGFASMIMVWFLGVFMMSLSTAKLGIHGSAYLAISVALAVFLLTHIIGPISGGHISPIVTLSTCITGLISPLKALAYVSAQMTGATLGGISLAMALGPRAADVQSYGCYFNPSPSFALSHAFCFEFMSALANISMMYGYGIKADSSTTQGGPKLAPLLNGITLGLFVFASSGFAPENSYLGTIDDWIYWIPSISASIVHGLAYRFLNPFGEPHMGKILGHEEISQSSPKVVIQMDGPRIMQEGAQGSGK
ncbi:uncharacterized protein MELLADRAFT_112885 [Melampsora larici-populina 98AG31]|uniref:Aquaporin n=1 Tax=Melampsora larici-populina (strain 98AG31 / pathotype 3-4-7) TaxID=747676 RepID=F4S803_MELLP|nr:uncharacterized protein MELLADRAFT_112885 [Melampsora larici-populina 98AG31]EGF99199.1 hypothetical protein MELLADRAFT_112885 [Melampsora larici-populina 98AG31]